MSMALKEYRLRGWLGFFGEKKHVKFDRDV
jgi:hypothetical protein